MQIIKLIKHLYHLQVIRYLFSAGTATLVDVGSYHVSLNYFLGGDTHTTIYGVTVLTTSVAFAIGASFGLVTNFIITKYFVFSKSNIAGHIQFFRYVTVAILVIAANFALTGFLYTVTPHFKYFETVDRGVSAITIGFLSFTVHRVFSFQIKPTDQT